MELVARQQPDPTMLQYLFGLHQVDQTLQENALIILILCGHCMLTRMIPITFLSEAATF